MHAKKATSILLLYHSSCHFKINKLSLTSISSELTPWAGAEAQAANTAPIRFIIIFQKLFACIPVNSFIHVLTHMPITTLYGIRRTCIQAAGTVTAFRVHRNSAFQGRITKHCCETLHRSPVRRDQATALADPAESRQMRSCTMAENTVKSLF